jgi:hypothetical protein
MRPFSRGSRQFAGALAIVAVLLLGISLGVSWYQLSTSTSSGSYSYSGTTTLYLGSQFQQTSSTTTTYGTTGGSASLPYSGHYNATGSLYGAVQVLVVVALLASIGAIVGLILAPRRGIGWDRTALVLIFIAFLIVLLVPIVVAADQPGAFASDVGNRYAGASSSPTATFYGSCANSGCGSGGAGGNAAISWGPSVGWFISWVAMILLFASLYVLWRGRSQGRHFLLQSPKPSRAALDRGWRAPPPAKSREAMDTPPALRDLPEPRPPWDESPPKWPKPPE